MYRLDQFKQLGLYIEKPDAAECQFEGGRVLTLPTLNVSDKIKDLLRTPESDSHQGDRSRQDSAIVTSMLSAGYQPADIFTTFFATPRGRSLEDRRPGHADDYLQRTIQKAVGFLQRDDPSDSARAPLRVDFSRRKNGHNKPGIVLSMANDVEVERVRWIWPGYIPSGKLTILAGDPGMGKSTITLDLISRITRGATLPSGDRAVTGTCIICSAEDSAEDTLVPRLVAAEARLDRVGIIREVRDEGLEDSRFLTLPKDLELLKDILKQKGCRILVIDPLNAFIEKGTDTYKDQDMRRVLHPLEALGEECGTAIFVVAHLTKREETSTLYRVGGSIGFIGAARSVLGVSSMDDGTRVLYSLKSNLAARPAPISYETREVRKTKKSTYNWKGEDLIKSNGIRWMGEVDFNPMAKTQTGIKVDVSADTVEFLQNMLSDTEEVESDVIFKEAKAAGIPRALVVKAKNHLGIRSVKRRDAWFWKLTPKSTDE